MIFKSSHVLILNTLLISFYFTSVDSVPEDYCLRPLNTSDCGGPPTPVFYYYKPGSRCEIKLWRGCPTGNLFKNEYHCSHHCIGKLWSSEEDDKVEGRWKTPESNVLIGLKYRCDVPIDRSHCKQAKQLVYTYDNETKKCTEVTYYGCPTENKFRDKDECEEVCEKTKLQWEHDISNLDLDELNKLNNMLDEVNDEILPEKEDLKKHVKDPKIRPHTVKDYDNVTDEPDDEINKVDNESKERTDNPEDPTDKTEKSTDKPEETTSQTEESTSKPEEPTVTIEEPPDTPEGPTDTPEEPTNTPEEPTDTPVEPTNTPEETTKLEEVETKAEADATVSSTDSAQDNTVVSEITTKAPNRPKRTRKRRSTKTVQEGDVVRGGFDYL